MIAAIIALERLQLARPIAGEILGRENAPAGLACRHDLRCDRAIVKCRRPAFRDRATATARDRFGPAAGPASTAGRLLRKIAALGASLRNSSAASASMSASPWSSTKPSRASPIALAISAARGASPVFRARELKSRDRARHPDREIAAAAARRDRIAVRIEVHGGRRRGGRGLAEIDEGGAPVMEANGHEPAAAKIAGLGKGDRQRIADGNGGIDRIAAGLEHVDPGLGRQPVGADDHAMLGSNRRRRRGIRGRRPRHRQGAHHCREEAQPLANHPIPPVKKEGSRSPPLKSIVQAINI